MGDVSPYVAVAQGPLGLARAGLMIGLPGSGKTMLAKRLPTILPRLTLPESLETTRIHLVAGEVSPGASLLATWPGRPILLTCGAGSTSREP